MENQETRSKSLFDPPVTSFGEAKKNGEEERASEKLGREEREETRYISTGGGGVERLIAKITADTRNRLGVRLSEHCLPWIQPRVECMSPWTRGT